MIAGVVAGRWAAQQVLGEDDPAPTFRGAVIDPPLPIQDFSAPASNGETFTLSSYKGSVVLLYFGYLACPDFCPTTMADLQRVYGALSAEEQARVQVVFVTVDPERDTLDKLALYTAAFNPAFVGVRQDDPILMGELVNQFGVVAARREVDSALVYLIDHTTSVFMLDPNGDLMNRFAYDTPYQDIVHDLQLVLR